MAVLPPRKLPPIAMMMILLAVTMAAVPAGACDNLQFANKEFSDKLEWPGVETVSVTESTFFGQLQLVASNPKCPLRLAHFKSCTFSKASSLTFAKDVMIAQDAEIIIEDSTFNIEVPQAMIAFKAIADRGVIISIRRNTFLAPTQTEKSTTDDPFAAIWLASASLTRPRVTISDNTFDITQEMNSRLYGVLVNPEALDGSALVSIVDNTMHLVQQQCMLEVVGIMFGFKIKTKADPAAPGAIDIRRNQLHISSPGPKCDIPTSAHGVVLLQRLDFATVTIESNSIAVTSQMTYASAISRMLVQGLLDKDDKVPESSEIWHSSTLRIANNTISAVSTYNLAAGAIISAISGGQINATNNTINLSGATHAVGLLADAVEKASVIADKNAITTSGSTSQHQVGIAVNAAAALLVGLFKLFDGKLPQGTDLTVQLRGNTIIEPIAGTGTVGITIGDGMQTFDHLTMEISNNTITLESPTKAAAAAVVAVEAPMEMKAELSKVVMKEATVVNSETTKYTTATAAEKAASGSTVIGIRVTSAGASAISMDTNTVVISASVKLIAAAVSSVGSVDASQWALRRSNIKMIGLSGGDFTGTDVWHTSDATSTSIEDNVFELALANRGEVVAIRWGTYISSSNVQIRRNNVTTVCEQTQVCGGLFNSVVSYAGKSLSMDMWESTLRFSSNAAVVTHITDMYKVQTFAVGVYVPYADPLSNVSLDHESHTVVGHASNTMGLVMRCDDVSGPGECPVVSVSDSTINVSSAWMAAAVFLDSPFDMNTTMSRSAVVASDSGDGSIDYLCGVAISAHHSATSLDDCSIAVVVNNTLSPAAVDLVTNSEPEPAMAVRIRGGELIVSHFDQCCSINDFASIAASSAAVRILRDSSADNVTGISLTVRGARIDTMGPILVTGAASSISPDSTMSQLSNSTLQLIGNHGNVGVASPFVVTTRLVDSAVSIQSNKLFANGSKDDLVALTAPLAPTDMVLSTTSPSASSVTIGCNMINSEWFVDIVQFRSVAGISFNARGCTKTPSLSRSTTIGTPSSTRTGATESKTPSASAATGTTSPSLRTDSSSVTRSRSFLTRTAGTHTSSTSRRTSSRTTSNTATNSASGATRSEELTLTAALLATSSATLTQTPALTNTATIPLPRLPACPSVTITTDPAPLTEAAIRSGANVTLNLTLPETFRWNDVATAGALAIRAAPISSLPDIFGFTNVVAATIDIRTAVRSGRTLVIRLPTALEYDITVDEAIEAVMRPDAVIPSCRAAGAGGSTLVVAGTTTIEAARDSDATTTEILGATTAATTTLVSIAGGGAAALDAQALAVMGQMSCARPADRSSTEAMMLFLSPFARISDAAVVLGNICLMFGFAALQFIGVKAFERRKGVELITGMAAFRFPGLSFSIACVLHQGVTFGTFQMVFNNQGGLEIFAAIVGCLYIAAVPSATYLTIKRLVRVSYTEYGPFRSRPRWMKFFLPTGFWTPDFQRNAFGKAFTSMNSAHIYWGIYPLAVITVVNFVASIRPPAAQCFLQFLIIGILFFVAAAIVARLRPHRSHFQNFAACVSLVSLCFVAISKAVQARYESQMAVRVQTAAVWAQLTITLCRMVYDGVILYMEMRYWHAMMRPKAQVLDEDFFEMDLLGTADAKKGDGDPLLRLADPFAPDLGTAVGGGGGDQVQVMAKNVGAEVETLSSSSLSFAFGDAAVVPTVAPELPRFTAAAAVRNPFSEVQFGVPRGVAQPPIDDDFL